MLQGVCGTNSTRLMAKEVATKNSAKAKKVVEAQNPLTLWPWIAPD